MFRILTTQEFDKDFEKLDTSIQRMIDNEIKQLEESPYVGKPLGYKFFREKKAKNYRVYYLIYGEYVVVFVVAISGKKDQQKVIAQMTVYRARANVNRRAIGRPNQATGTNHFLERSIRENHREAAHQPYQKTARWSTHRHMASTDALQAAENRLNLLKNLLWGVLRFYTVPRDPKLLAVSNVVIVAEIRE